MKCEEVSDPDSVVLRQTHTLSCSHSDLLNRSLTFTHTYSYTLTHIHTDTPIHSHSNSIDSHVGSHRRNKFSRLTDRDATHAFRHLPGMGTESAGSFCEVACFGVCAGRLRAPWRTLEQSESSLREYESLVGRSWGLLGGLWGPSWTVLGPSWAVFGAWAVLGPPCGARGPSWGHPVALLGLSWEPFGTFWGPSCAVLGLSWAVLEPSWAVLGPSWGPRRPAWGDLGGLLRRLGRCSDQ